MGAPLPPLQISTNDLIKLFRKWGWQNVGEGVKQVRFKKDRASITIKRSKDPKGIPAEPANEAAIHDGVSLDVWLKGPTEIEKTSELDQDDLDWFLRQKLETLTDREERSRYRHIRRILSNEGTLTRYLKIAEEIQTTTTFVPGQENPAAKPAPIEPLEVEVDTTGYISLTEALKIVGKKPTKINLTSCEIVAILADTEVFSPDGKATAVLMNMMPSHKRGEGVTMAGLSMALKNLERGGLIWRQMPHSKATSRIGLCMPVKLTDEERAQYGHVKMAWIPRPEDEQEQEPERPQGICDFHSEGGQRLHHQMPPCVNWRQPAEPLVEDSAEPEEVEGDSTRPPSSGVSHTGICNINFGGQCNCPVSLPLPMMGPSDDPAVKCLRDKVEWHQEQIDMLLSAINVLQENL